MTFAGIMIIPLIYYVIMAVWLPQSMLERFQYLLGLFIFVVLGPFLNIAVMVFAVFNMDSFGWGKTRKVVTEAPEEQVQEKHKIADTGSGSSSSQVNAREEVATGVLVMKPAIVYVPATTQHK
ncbi:chitin synthase [Fusarium flagelliforme]|uniref:Chitin synthase n=1 Tax=Fusarium flagelliforme TaxID=2675880 RepID=A0A395N2E4_9HYPO|nr:chitin synthase [Fusarium flagelliforme]